MSYNSSGKGKIFNDPIYGFITIPYETIFKLVEHPYFQRLRRIKQLGLTHLIYSGAHHTRFHHALGATHLMVQAINTLRSKGADINEEESEAACIAILLHDIGHGPYSHALEHSLVQNIDHETISLLFMEELNSEFDGKLSMAIEIFQNKYHKPFLHQLVSSQLDMDRMDYLRRDTFFSGVTEGAISSERIIKLLTVADDHLAVEAKGIYSVEKFIVARRLMYWQVYLHKAVLSAEYTLIQILARVKTAIKNGEDLFCSPALKFFLGSDITQDDFKTTGEPLAKFALLDDFDIKGAIKVWAQDASDPCLRLLCDNLIRRRLNRCELKSAPVEEQVLSDLRTKAMAKYGLDSEEVKHLVFTDKVTNSAYNPEKDRINILFKNGETKDITEAADLLNISSLSKAVNKYLLSYPKDLLD